MKFNLVTSELEMLGNSVVNLKIENGMTEYSNELSKSFGMDVKDISIKKHEKKKIGTILLDIQVDVDGEDAKCNIDMEVEGIFSTDENTEDEQFMHLLYINGVSALIGIARGKIEAVTASIFNSGKISIPFVNVLEYYKEVISKPE